eukprot:gene28051-47721_t
MSAAERAAHASLLTFDANGYYDTKSAPTVDANGYYET